MHYDHISFHLDEHFPPDLPQHHAAHHIGYYYRWAVYQNLHSSAAAALPSFDNFQNGRTSAARFIIDALHGGIDTTCFNDLGNRFTQYYYSDEEEGYGRFISDYFTALDLETQSSFYHTAETAAHQQQLNTVFQNAFNHWQASLKPAARS